MCHFPCDSVLTAGEIRQSHNVIIHNRRNHGSVRDLLALSSAALGKGWCREGDSSYPLQCVQFQFFAPVVFVTSVLDFWTSTKSLLSIGDWVTQYSPQTRRIWLRETGAYSRVTSGFTARTKVHMPITWHTGRQYSSQVPQHMALVTEPKANGAVAKFWGLWNCFWVSHLGKACFSKWLSSLLDCTEVSLSPTCTTHLPQRHFCPWIAIKLLLLKEGYEQWTSYSVILLPSLLCVGFSFFFLQ